MSCGACIGHACCCGTADRAHLAKRLRALDLGALATILDACPLDLVSEPVPLALMAGLVDEIERRTVAAAALRGAGERAERLLAAAIVSGRADEDESAGVLRLLRSALGAP